MPKGKNKQTKQQSQFKEIKKSLELSYDIIGAQNY